MKCQIQCTQDECHRYCVVETARAINTLMEDTQGHPNRIIAGLVGRIDALTREIESLRAAQPAVPEGYALVPGEITIPMRDAFYNAMHTAIFEGKSHQLSYAYRAMLAASQRKETPPC